MALVKHLPGSTEMYRLGLQFPEWNARPLQGYSLTLNLSIPVINLGGERHCESKVSRPRTHHDVPSQDINLHCSTGDKRTNNDATAPPHIV